MKYSYNIYIKYACFDFLQKVQLINYQMNKPILTLLFTILATLVFSQKSEQPYFQQEVNYDLQVILDDKNHTLSGFAKIEYINNSPDDLKEIYFHLWANAYQSQQTAFAKQQIQNGSTAFFFAEKLQPHEGECV